jgi:hypothetical protein
MKRLVDESTDELTRSLLVAGIEHRPPPGNRRRVMLALGAGGAFGLLSSNAFAWLSTTAGKVTAASVVVGIAGAALVVVPAVRNDAAPEVQNTAHGPMNAASDGAPLRPSSAERSAAPSGADPSSAAASNPDGQALGHEPSGSSPSVTPDTTPAANRMPVADEHAADESGEGTAERAPSAAPAKSVAKARQRSRKAARKNASAKPAKSGEGTVAQTTSTGSASGVGVDDRLAGGHPDLDAEVRLVDDMHRAVRRNDDEALRGYIERYRMTFPDGQLGKEVAAFAARLAASKASESDGTASD